MSNLREMTQNKLIQSKMISTMISDFYSFALFYFLNI